MKYAERLSQGITTYDTRKPRRGSAIYWIISVAVIFVIAVLITRQDPQTEIHLIDDSGIHCTVVATAQPPVTTESGGLRIEQDTIRCIVTTPIP